MSKSTASETKGASHVAHQRLVRAKNDNSLITPKERADRIIQDILVNHLPRIVEGLHAGYVDENQILVMYDHAVRARLLTEHKSSEYVEAIQAQIARIIAGGSKNGKLIREQLRHLL